MKILTALAQAGRALSTVQIGTRCGLSAGTGSFAQAIAALRSDEYWCHKVGGAGAKILRALRQRHRDRLGPATTAELGASTGLSHGTGSFAQALAKLRRLELIEGGGSGMVLSPELQQAAEITVGVYDRQNGKTIRVDRGGKVWADERNHLQRAARPSAARRHQDADSQAR